MAAKIILSRIIIVIISLGLTYSQDTSGHGHGHHPGHNSVHQKSSEISWDVLEQRLNHKIHESEHRLIWRIQEKFKRINSSLSLKYLDNLYEWITDELEMNRENEAVREIIIQNLKEEVSRQNNEIDVLNRDIRELKKTMLDLNESIKKINYQSDAAHKPDSTTPEPPLLFPLDCESIFLNGDVQYPGEIYPQIQPLTSYRPFNVTCRMTDDHGWTLIQRRQDGSVDFFRDWEQYKNGFGELDGEFWLGLDSIYKITNQADYRLRVEMIDYEGAFHWAEYDHFRLGNEEDKYRLYVSGYQGNAGDPLSSKPFNHSGIGFSTYDRDNDLRNYDNCAKDYHGAWWFKSCFEAHLNGNYYSEGDHRNEFIRDGIHWKTMPHEDSLKYTVMMITRNIPKYHESAEKRQERERQIKRLANGV